uniref:Uncharacterized protein n=1 Tax=Lotharella oceanica TaxID=641309 RepID=A0A7S2XF93_9EUKA
MGKLHDLMSMGVKYQLMSVKRPAQIIEITCNHMDGMIDLLKGSPAVDKVKAARTKFVATYGALGNGQLSMLRRALLLSLQDWRVKISTFLRLKIQAVDGTFIVKSEGDCPGHELPGAIHYKTGTKEKVTVGNAKGVNAKGKVRTLNGFNIWYEKDGLEKAKKLAESGEATLSEKPTSTMRTASSTEAKIDKAKAQLRTAELNALADLLTTKKSPEKKGEKFTLENMFAAKEIDNTEKKSTNDPSVEVVEFGGKSAMKAWSSKVAAKLNLDDAPAPPADDGGEEDDLLALMDS